MATQRSVPRTVEVRPRYYVPGLPTDLLEDVRGADAHVEFAVLIAEYWTQPNISPFLAHSELLKTLPKYLDAKNIDAFVRLLSRRGHATAFFNLLRDDVDRHEDLRKFLKTLGLFEDTYIQYATFATSPKLLLDGFLYGVGESFAAIVKDLPEMAKLMWRAVEEWRLLFFLSLVSPSAAEARAGSHIATLMLVWDGVKDKLSPAYLPIAAWIQFNTWKKEFGDHLAHLRPFEAGRLLGKTAGDLYQLLTGLVGMVKVLRVSAKVAAQFGPLLLTSGRELAQRGSASVVMLARFLVGLGPKTLQALPRVGMATLTTLFPPEVLERLITGRSGIFKVFEGTSVCVVSEPALVAAAGGSLDGGFALMVMQGEKPILFATATAKEVVASAPVAEEAAAAAEALAEPLLGEKAAVEKAVDQVPVLNLTEATFDEAMRELWRELSGQGKGKYALTPNELGVLAAQWAQLSQRMERQLGGALRAQAIRTFLQMKAQKGYVLPHILGLGTHSGMAKEELVAFLAKTAPNVRPIAEATLSTSFEVMAGMDKRLAPMAVKAKALCSERVVKFLLRRPDLLKILKIEGADEAAVIKFVKRWGYKETTLIGNLRSDAILVDTELATIRNIDWTSSTKAQNFEKAWREIAESFGATVPKELKAAEASSVDWSAVAKKYQAMYSGKELPENVSNAIQDLRALQAHAERETVLRKAILDEALEHVRWSWHVSSQEVLYPGVDELYKLLKVQ